ncbi:hypothetical protein D3C81_1167110 [compost metagenome]
MAGRCQVLVLATIGGLGGVTGFDQFVGALGDPLLKLVIELLQALLGQLALGDIGDKTFDHAVFVRTQQQVHQHVDMAAVTPAQPGFIADQCLLALQHLGDGQQFILAASEQVAGQVVARQHQCLCIGITQHARQRRIGRTHAIFKTGLEDAVHRMLEQPLVAIALGLQLFKAYRQFRVVALAYGVVAQPQQPGQGVARRFRGPRHTPPRHHAGWSCAGWSGCTDHPWRAGTKTGCRSCRRHAGQGFRESPRHA